MLKLGVFASCDAGLNVGKSLVDSITEFLEFVEVADKRVDFFIDVARFVDLFIDCAVGVDDSDGR